MRKRMVRSKRVLRPVIIVGVVTLSLASFAVVWLSRSPKTVVPAHSAGPNIVFVLTDDLSWNLVRYMPHVQAMERQGATFSKYVVTDSLCCPSRSSIMTGEFPHNSGVFANTGADGGFDAFLRNGDEHRTFSVALKQSGYTTAMMGKYLNGYSPTFRVRGRSYIPPGWSDWDVTGNGYPEYDYDLNQNRHVVHYGHKPQAYLTTVLSGLASSFITNAAEQARLPAQATQRHPFMLDVSTFAPHSPYISAPSDADRFDNVNAPKDPSFDRLDTVGNPKWLDLPPLSPVDIRRIDGTFRDQVRAVQAVDRMVGRLQHQLAVTGLAKDTYFVFSSDNGLHMGQHRLEPGKMTAFDTDIKVPLIIDGPGIRPGTKISALAENIDLAPTFEQLAGLTPPRNIDGRSLVTLLDRHGSTTWRRAALIEHHGPDLDTSDPDYPAHDSGNPPSYEALRLGNALYVEYVDGEREYYDIATDPYELRNIYSDLSAKRRSVLHRELVALERCKGATACHAAERLDKVKAVT